MRSITELENVVSTVIVLTARSRTRPALNGLRAVWMALDASARTN
jgi:hypothetical protein